MWKMKSQLFLFVFVVGLVHWSSAFDIEKTELFVEINGSEITLSVPDEPELVSVLFSIELDDECTSGFTFVYNQNNDSAMSHTQDINKILKSGDKLRIVGVFQSMDQFIKTEYDYVIDQRNNAIKQDYEPMCDCKPSQTEMDTHVVRKCSGTLIYSEEFNDSLNGWKHEVRNTVFEHSPLQEFVTYLNNEANSYLKDGNLHLNATKVKKNYKKKSKLPDCTSKSVEHFSKHCKWDDTTPVHSAKVHNRDKFNFKFGRVEIRARLPIGDWLFPYLLLFPHAANVEDSYVNHIRIAYARGNINSFQDVLQNEIGAGTVFGSAVLWSEDRKPVEYRCSRSIMTGQYYGDEFHNYTVIWRRDQIIFKVDERTYGTITDPLVLNTINQHEHFIALGLTVGGGVNFPDDYVLKAQKTFSNEKPTLVQHFRDTIKPVWKRSTLDIDYVRVYTVHEEES